MLYFFDLFFDYFFQLKFCRFFQLKIIILFQLKKNSFEMGNTFEG